MSGIVVDARGDDALVGPEREDLLREVLVPKVRVTRGLVPDVGPALTRVRARRRRLEARLEVRRTDGVFLGRLTKFIHLVPD